MAPGRPKLRARKAKRLIADAAWAPQPGGQVQGITCPAFEVLFEGPRGTGKSELLLMAFGQHVGHGFGQHWRGVLFRQTYPQLGDLIAKSQKWFPLIWPEATYNIGAHEWRWPSGEVLLLRHFDKPRDYWQYHGHEFAFIGWDELCNWPTPEGYKLMMSCCRSSRARMPRMYRATANAYGPGHNWVKARFRLPAWRGKVIKGAKDDDGNALPPRVAIQTRLEENRVLLAADPLYIDRIRAAARNPAELAAWIDGSWDIVAGGMLDDVWDAAVHIVPRFEVPASWFVDRSFDWGSSKPFSVGWWACSDGSELTMPDGTKRQTVPGDLFRIAEWYGWNGKPNEGLRMSAREIARGILDRERKMGLRDRIIAGPADSSIFTVENAASIAVDMSAEGVHWLPANKAPGTRKQGWQLMRDRLRDALPGDKPRERPGLFICDGCDQWQRTMPVLPRSGKDLDDVDTDAEDHIADEARYRLLAAVLVARQTQPAMDAPDFGASAGDW